ncbi:NAD(P)H-binding protein [Streptomyces sp. NPDC001985]|uniref:NAD(P)H-binding protein n=1 Tax=Streptomyces sp. NPDC001985 TaxID=3154406 RepID=UPI00333232B2
MTENMKQNTVLVTSATGKTGRRVAQRLTESGVAVRAGSRKAGTGPGEAVLDWESPATWGPALEGVDAACVAYYPDLAYPGAVDAMRGFGRAAAEAGVGRLVLLSGRGEPEAVAAESALRESGVDLTVVRAAFFAQNFSEGALADGVAHGVIPFPAGGTAEPFIDADDLAEVMVVALTGEGHAGRTYEVTGPRLVTFDEAAAEITRATGREVRYAPVSEEEFRGMLPALGFSEPEAAWLAGLFAMLMDGHNQSVTEDVRRVLGREPKDFREFALDTASAGAWAR